MKLISNKFPISSQRRKCLYAWGKSEPTEAVALRWFREGRLRPDRACMRPFKPRERPRPSDLKVSGTCSAGGGRAEGLQALAREGYAPSVMCVWSVRGKPGCGLRLRPSSGGPSPGLFCAECLESWEQARLRSPPSPLCQAARGEPRASEDSVAGGESAALVWGPRTQSVVCCHSADSSVTAGLPSVETTSRAFANCCPCPLAVTQRASMDLTSGSGLGRE